MADNLVEEGRRKLEFARSRMPVIKALGDEIKEKGTLRDVPVSMALHTEAKTGILALTLAEAGAKVRLTSCNPLSTDDSVVQALQNTGKLKVNAKYGQTREDYYKSLNWALDQRPQVVIDDGGDLVRLLHTERRDLLKHVKGGCEETTTGIIRLKALQSEGGLEFPMMDVNNCLMKHLFDNRYGTGQSTMDGILTATNTAIAGMRCVVAGYGWCGRGIAMRLQGLGGRVTVCEVDPVKAVEAAMDGFGVAKMKDACRDAGLIVTATGCKEVVNERILYLLPDGVILANSGHFDNEIDVKSLELLSERTKTSREHVRSFEIEGRSIHLLSEGRLVNLAAGQGHPIEIMDLSFALQAAGAEMIASKGDTLPNEVIPFPPEIDQRIAFLKLEAMGYSIDDLTESQIIYLSSWEEGT